MDPRLVSLIAAHRVFLRSEARDLGYDDKTVTRLVRAKLWHRVRRGAYTFHSIWSAADAVERHRITSAAVMRSLEGRVALCHVSSLIEQGIDLFNPDLSRVHVVRLDDGSGRIEPDLVHHEGDIGRDDVVTVDGRAVLRTERALLQYAVTTSIEAGLVSVDSALHQQHADLDELKALHRRMERWTGSRRLHIVLGIADHRSESVGESRARYLFFTLNLPKPELQFEVRGSSGELIGITDFAWLQHRLLGEFDGRIKYGRLLKPGQDPGDVVFEEKRREDRLREETGFRMIRLVNDDLSQGAEVAARFRRLLLTPA